MLGNIPTADPFTVGDHSLFTATLLDALGGKADVEGYEPDGLVTVDELVKYLEKEMQEQARKLGKDKKEKESSPFIVGEEQSHFVLSMNPKVTETIEKRLKSLDKVAYVRFASVYLDFKDVTEFMSELRLLVRKQAK